MEKNREHKHLHAHKRSYDEVVYQNEHQHSGEKCTHEHVHSIDEIEPHDHKH